jgi:geranylgeranyl diphosphate synthase type II
LRPEMTLKGFVSSQAAIVERRLERILAPGGAHPSQISRAMRYAVLGGGKRLRPVMCLMGYRAAGGRGRVAYPVACAVELIHSFSLIHDDLPCMDDDDYRRGRPTVHKKFGEAMAVLAGDALLARAFEILAETAQRHPDHSSVMSRMTCELAASIGASGMIGGQVMDLLSEGRKVPVSTVRYIHSSKTGCLITATLRFGGALGGASPRVMRSLTRYGREVGLAFQIRDDVLGVTSTLKQLGKRPGGDARKKKATYPGVIGLDASRRELGKIGARAKKECGSFGDWAAMFEELADFVCVRDS